MHVKGDEQQKDMRKGQESHILLPQSVVSIARRDRHALERLRGHVQILGKGNVFRFAVDCYSLDLASTDPSV